MSENKVACPLCHDGDMVYTSIKNEHASNDQKATHAWICDSCPSVLFEYYDKTDTVALSGHLDPYPKSVEELTKTPEYPGQTRFSFLTNSIGEETGVEQLYERSGNGVQQKLVPLPSFKNEYDWWQHASGSIETAYVVDKNTNQRGFLYTEEFIYVDTPDARDKMDAIEDGAGDCEAEFKRLQALARYLSDLCVSGEVVLGYKTGPFGRHELCVFMPCGTIGTDIAGAIEKVVRPIAIA